VVQTQPPVTAAPGMSSAPPNLQSPLGQQQNQAAQQIPSNIASGSGPFNPLVGLTGARYAGQVPLPNASLFGPDRILPHI